MSDAQHDDTGTDGRDEQSQTGMPGTGEQAAQQAAETGLDMSSFEDGDRSGAPDAGGEHPSQAEGEDPDRAPQHPDPDAEGHPSQAEGESNRSALLPPPWLSRAAAGG